MACLSIAGVCDALGGLCPAFRHARRQSGSEVDRAKEAAEARIGRLPVEGRYHRLPRRLEDDYELARGEKLGIGYNGAVVPARSRRTGEKLAVKTFSLVSMDASDRERLAGELGVYLSMDHPHVARLLAVYESETEISMVMECCEGGELYHRLRDKKVFTEEEAAQAAWQMLLAVNYLHSEGVVHRDLKLENFLYDERGSEFLKLIDFGFSKFFKTSTEMNESSGTLYYMAPEVLDVDISYSGGSCDLWSLGVVVFALLAGRLPFDGLSDSEIARGIWSGKFAMPKAHWSRISRTAQDFVKRLLVVEPSGRMTAQQAMRHPWLARQNGMGLAAGSLSSASRITVVAANDVARAFLSFARATRFQQACMQMMAWSLPSEERRLLRDTFLEMDSSHVGVLRVSQLDQLLEERLHMSKVDRATVHKAMAVLDTNKDGELHYSDFLAVMMAPRLRKRDCDSIEEAFRNFDAQGLGYLTQEGLWRKLSKEVSGSELQRAFRLLDVDHDDKVYLEDFAAYLREGAMFPTRVEPGLGWFALRSSSRRSSAGA